MAHDSTARSDTEAAAVSGGRRWRLPRGLAGAAVLAVAGVLAAMTRLHVTGEAQGLFVLRPGEGSRLEITDDLYLGQGSRLLAGISFSGLRNMLRHARPPARGAPSLELDWDEVNGRGIVRNRLEDGREIVTVFSRYDADGDAPRGLFLGGSLAEVAADRSRRNESGMAVKDERGWRHIWCNINEAIQDSRKNFVYPSTWKFLGSRVLIRDTQRVVIESSHEVEIDGKQMHVNRFAYFRAGNPWFKLGIRIVNAGDGPVRFSYDYGDEPWVGNFGSGKTNIGWVKDGVVRTEGYVDARMHRWAGILDEREKVANFISWVGEELPSTVYFSNVPGTAGLVPGRRLTSNKVFIGLEWRDRVLQPGEGASILLSLGIADMDAETGRPRLPLRLGPW